MARVTVEDCLKNVKNRFELVLISSKRARQIAQGAEPLVELENDKPTVVALREIAEGLIDAAILDEKEVESVEWGSDTETRDGESESQTAEGTKAKAESGGEIDVAAALAAALAMDLGMPPATEANTDAGTDSGETIVDASSSADSATDVSGLDASGADDSSAAEES